MNAYFDPEEDAPARHHHRHHHHGRHDHSGTTGADLHADHVTNQGDTHVTNQGDTHVTNQGDTHVTNQGDTHVQTMRGLGVPQAIQHILEAVNALPTRYERKIALGHALARLVEQSRISSLGDVLQAAMGEVNRYSHIDDDQDYAPHAGKNHYR